MKIQYRFRCEIRDSVDMRCIAKFVSASNMQDANNKARKLYGKLVSSVTPDGPMTEFINHAQHRGAHK